jgi:alpha-galactosidase/6-phospho-beta-glucosidase family protein
MMDGSETTSDIVFVLVGAGSTVFTPGLLRDLARSPLSDRYDVRLVDLNADAARTMAQLGSRICEWTGSRMRVSAFTDRREALPAARFVVTTIAVGSAPGWRADLDVPARHGIQQTVGDTVGPGGVLRALRHVPELVAIARDIEELAPTALLVNYSNPLTANVRAVTRATAVRTIGLCHGTMHTKIALAAELGVAARELQAVFAGLNHLCWLLDVRVGTEDLYPRLRELAGRRPTAGRDAESDPREGLHQPVSADLLATFGRYPAPGDRHVSEFFGQYLAGPIDGTLAWGLQGGQDMTRRYIEEKSDLWDRLHAQARGEADLDIGGNQEAERLVAIAEAVVTGHDLVELAVNVPNRGAVCNLPPEAVVEVPAVVNASGVTPLAVGALPAGIAAVLSARAQQQEITVEAALTRDPALAVEALVLDPLVPDSGTARAILRDAAAAQPETLGAFR